MKDSPVRFMCGTHGFRVVEDNDCEECAAILADARRFQKPSGEAELDDKLPAEPSIRVRENGDVAGVASGHPEDSSASPGHRDPSNPLPWSFLSRSVSDWSYVFGTSRFGTEQGAREYFESAKAHATEHGGAGSLHHGGKQVDKFSIWCPND